MKALFIHRSVGHHLIEQGDIRNLLKNQNIEFDDYDNNLGILTDSGGDTHYGVIVMPGNNTNPDNLAQFFTEWPDVLNNYNLIIIKSCYPNSHIKSEEQLNMIKGSYAAIFKSFKQHNKKLFILTSPPLRPLFTNKMEAQLSSDIAHWLVSFSSDVIRVFDFHHLLSESKGRHKSMLKKEYRRLLPFDNHPNQKAHQFIGPKLVEMISKDRDLL